MKVLLSGLSHDRVELRLAEALFRSGVDLYVLAHPDSPAEPLCREWGVPFSTIHFRHRFDRTAIHRYRELNQEQPFDIIHCLTNRALSTALRAVKPLPSPPKIVAYRGTMGHLSWLDPASHFSYLNRRVDHIICVSNAVRSYLKTFRIPDERLSVIWKGHDPAWYTPAPRETLGRFGIPDDALVVCFTGNMRPVKGVKYLLQAFHGIPPSAKIHLLIIGEVRDKKVKREVNAWPHVHFLGYRDDATALTGACDISVMPSIEREGLPKATLEAMSQGLPVIVTNVGGLVELVPDRVCGMVVPPRDAGALREAIRTLAGAPATRRRMGQAARQRIDTDFNFAHTVTKTIDLYRRLLTPEEENRAG